MRTITEPRRLAWTTFLAALAVAGVLLMHGFDAAAADLVGSAHHDASPVDSEGIHGLIGLCVFVMSIVAMVDGGRRSRPRHHPRAAMSTTIPAAIDTVWVPSGRLRLFELCVLRN
jgi:hypothetical protein